MTKGIWFTMIFSPVKLSLRSLYILFIWWNTLSRRMARYLAISLTLSNGNGGSAPYFLCYNSRMGSGKGKARRVQTASVKAVSATATIPRTKYDRKVWSQFVKDSELKSLSLREYYLGSYENPNPKTWGYLTEESVTVDGSLKILTELFADA